MGRFGSSQLQYYRHDYAKVCMTGLLGCRWHRYQQSTNGSRKRDLLWFTVCLLVSLYVVFWFYFWLIVDNDRLDLNIFMFNNTSSRMNWFLLVLVLFSVLFAYVVIVMFLSVCHIIQGHQLYTHPVHLTLMLLFLAACIALTVTIQEIWQQEWQLIWISLQVFGPFLQLGSVVFMTALSWIIISKWLQLIRLEWKIFSVILYCVVMLMLYLSPLFINSPCVILKEDLPPKPKIFAHRGASGISPENTVISFEKAAQYQVYGIETDIQISYDGVLFIMHDKTLQRTTNVEEWYPDLAEQPASLFNYSQLSNLSAGIWFIQNDPSNTVSSLSEEDKSLYTKQQIPTLLETLQLCVKHNLAVMIELKHLYESHPFYDVYPDLLDIVSISGINKSKVYWPDYDSDFIPPREWNLLSPYMESIENLQQSNSSGILFENMVVEKSYIQQLKENNFTSSAYLVNKPWLYSYYWCLGVDTITTNYCDIITQVHTPIWHLSPRSYVVLWVITDCSSAVLIIIMFIIQRYRLYNNRYHPERMSLSSISNGNGTWGPSRSSWRPHRTRRSMKEKLLMRDIQADVFEPEDDLGIDSTGYHGTVTESEGRQLAKAFHSNRTSYLSNISNNEGSDINSDLESNRRSYHSNMSEGTRSSFVNPNENDEVFVNNKDSYQRDNETTQNDIPT